MPRKYDEYDRWMELSDETDALITWAVSDYGSAPSGMWGPPEHYDPGSGPELYMVSARDEDGRDVAISDEEAERLMGIIADNPDWWTPEPYDYD